MSSLEAHYPAENIEDRILQAIRNAGLNPEQLINPEELGALDHFHTGGLMASRELMELAEIGPEDYVLDIGAGLAGAARFLASCTGCKIDCLEMSEDYCIGANLLNRITGLENQINVHQGNALALPFPDDRFDVFWMQNVGMNIDDKNKLYQEIYRVLKPGGKFVFQEMAAGELETIYYPLPWASVPDCNHLIPKLLMSDILGTCGFQEIILEDTSDTHLNRPVSNAKPSAENTLSLGAYVENLGEKAGNARRSLEEGRVRLIRGLFIA